MQSEANELAEAAKSRPGDQWAAVWPSDIEHNISAAAHVAAKRAVKHSGGRSMQTDPTKLAASLTEAQRKVFTSRKRPNDYRAEDALALCRMGLLSFTPMGDVITSPLGVVVRQHLQEHSK